MSSHHPFGFSQISGDPTFRSAALNAVAIVPLLSNRDGTASAGNDTRHLGGGASKSTETHSAESFHTLWEALSRHTTASPLSEAAKSGSMEELLLVVANSSLTRPGDWRYQETPLKAYHWQYGCQRLRLFDGRPEKSRLAQDRLLNPHITRDWIDLCPSRRTAAVIGVLNIHDCQTQQDFERAQEELHHWATQRYATPPYQVTAHGSMGIERDQPVERLFVFDSFDEDCQHIDLSKATSSSSILAFPPSDEAHSQMMDLHLNVVINDLVVAIFQSLETKIRQSDELAQKGSTAASTTAQSGSTATRRVISRYISGGSADSVDGAEAEPSTPTNLSLRSIAGLVSPDNKLAQDPSNKPASQAGETVPAGSGVKKSPPRPNRATSPAKPASTAVTKPSTAANLRRVSGTQQQTPPQLMTPLDDYYEWSTSQLSSKDTDALRRRDMARREKMAADLSLMAGSPLDAYERYLKAAHMSQTHPDPLWYAMSLLGCAAAHIAMAEAGGYNVDEYLENNFSLPDDILALAVGGSHDTPVSSSGKQTFPEVVFALCEEAMAILNRHPQLAPFHAGLLLQMALYTTESAENHLRCRWGVGPGSYSGGESPPYRWEKATQVKASLLKTKDGRDMIDINVMNRVKTICELLQQAVAVPDLDPATRLDVACQSARLFLEGIPGTKWKEGAQERIQLPRKAAYFSVVAAEAMSSLNDTPNSAMENLWLLSCQLYSRRSNQVFGVSDEIGSYGWATLRASTLHALSLQGTSPVALEASEMLLTLLEQIKPGLPSSSNSKGINSVKAKPSAAKPRPAPVDVGSSHGSDMDLSVGDQSGEETYTSSVTKMFRESFTQVTGQSSLLTTQAKWASDAPKKPILVPLASQLPPKPKLLSLPCVWQKIGYTQCSAAQRQCTERQKQMKKGLSTSSNEKYSLRADPSSTPVPLSVSSIWSLEACDDFKIQLVTRKAPDPKVDKGAMATFYNPFEKSGIQQLIEPVPADEERIIKLSMTNFLSVPLQVKECELEFGGSVRKEISSSPISFVLPASVENHSVKFPFTVLAGSEDLESNEFEVKGVSFSCVHRRFYLSLQADTYENEKSMFELPRPAVYPHASAAKKSESVAVASPKIQALPSQPRLRLRHTGSNNILIGSTKLELCLTDGELVSTPTFELMNDTGPTDQGMLERIQVSVLGIPGGPSEKILLDSENNESTDKSSDSDSDFLRSLSSPNSPLLKVRVLPGTNLLPESLNSTDPQNLTARTLCFQIAASEQLSEKLTAGGSVELTARIRYTGKCTPTKEIWRQFDIQMKLLHFKGPHVTSITFRPDLTENPIVPGFLHQLARRRRTNSKKNIEYESSEAAPVCRVGLDQSSHVLSSTFVAIVAILNDSSSDIVLSRPSGAPVSAFGSASLSTFLVPRGVKVNLPMYVPRLSRSSADEGHFAEELIKATHLSWKTVESQNTHHFAQGSMSIKEAEISNLIAKTPSVIPSIFSPPCSIQLCVQGNDTSKGIESKVAPGEPVDMSVDVSIAPWVSADIVQRCSFSVELFALWLEPCVVTPAPRDHLWSGMVRRKFELKEMEAKHAARVVLLQRGNYTLSACVRFSQDGAGDEVWWVSKAASVTVEAAQQ